MTANKSIETEVIMEEERTTNVGESTLLNNEGRAHKLVIGVNEDEEVTETPKDGKDRKSEEKKQREVGKQQPFCIQLNNSPMSPNSERRQVEQIQNRASRFVYVIVEADVAKLHIEVVIAAVDKPSMIENRDDVSVFVWLAQLLNRSYSVLGILRSRCPKNSDQL